MTHTLCDYCGFDSKGVRERLRMLDMHRSDHALAQILHDEVMVPRAEEIVGQFYGLLSGREEMDRRAGGRMYDTAQLKQAQAEALRNLGLGFDHTEYFEQRLRVALMHHHADIPLQDYQCAYRLVQQLVIESMPSAGTADDHGHNALLNFVLKATALDVSLAIDAYRAASMHGLAGELNTVLHAEERPHARDDLDALTGLANRDYVIRVLDEAASNVVRSGESLCVLMADIDNLTVVNRDYGASMGDRLLQDIAARMRAAIRRFDIAGRIGGEEFVVILHNTNAERGWEIAERIRGHVIESPFHMYHRTIRATISQGVVIARQGDTAASLLARAEMAVKQAKEAGRNCVISAS